MGKAVAAKQEKFTNVNCNYVVDEGHVPLAVGAIGNLLGHGNENMVSTTKYTAFTFLPRGTWWCMHYHFCIHARCMGCIRSLGSGVASRD